MSAPLIAVSGGEPAGIGPELIEAAWAALHQTQPLYWLGDPAHLPGTVPHRVLRHPSEARAVSATALPVVPVPSTGPRTPGRPQPSQAAAVVAAIEAGAQAVMAGEADALCTLPIHKDALMRGAGFDFPGHTEFLSALAGGVPVAMMLASDLLRVVPATIHIPLAAVPAALSVPGLTQTIRIVHQGLIARFGIARPRIAVAGLNPHAGENGQMGGEEAAIIEPALAALRAEGMEITGPHSADTLFHASARARYDVAVAMYHDQALIPIKTLAFDEGVNVTLGLPFVRTSPDHGTALDIAGQGRANPASTIAALRLAAQMAGRS